MAELRTMFPLIIIKVFLLSATGSCKGEGEEFFGC